MFNPLPLLMCQLEDAVSRLNAPSIPPPPLDMSAIAERMRLVYAEARSGRYSSLGTSDWRKLPFAYWVKGQPSLTQLEPELVQQYWQTQLPRALQLSPNKAKRWLAPLAFIYCECFTADDPNFNEFASRIQALLPMAKGLYAHWLCQLHLEHQFFNPHDVTLSLAHYFFLSEDKELEHSIAHLKIWPSFVESALGNAIFKAGLALPAEKLRVTPAVSRLLDWAEHQPAHVVRTELRVDFANHMLTPWKNHRPADFLKNKLMDFFTGSDGYGDPRLPSNLNYQWADVSNEAKGVMLHWLTGDTLRVFMKVLQKTADEIWQYREKFWMAYYERGCIDEAWVALGDDALKEVKKLSIDQKHFGNGRLISGASKKHTVLILKMGDLIFTEWSHNGSLRAYRTDNPDAPRLYLKYYHGHELRRVTSLDFHDGSNMNPELRHMNSEMGTWQRTARSFISKHTGVYLADRDIL